MKKFVILCITLLFALSAQALEFTVDNLKYTTNADSTSVTVKKSAIMPAGDLVIPSHVTYNGKKYAVIRVEGFGGCTELTSVTIPEGVTSIENGTFDYCISITSITVPKSVISIGGYAFNECMSLASITIPEGVKLIEMRTFYGCSSLVSIALPESITSIGEEAFMAL